MWLGGAMWSAPQAEQRQFRGQAIPARGGKLVGRGRGPPHGPDIARARIRRSRRLTGPSRCGEARRRSGVHVVRTMISEVPASRGRMPLNDWSWADRHEGRREPGPAHPHPPWRPAGSPSRAARGELAPGAGGGGRRRHRHPRPSRDRGIPPAVQRPVVWCHVSAIHSITRPNWAGVSGSRVSPSRRGPRPGAEGRDHGSGSAGPEAKS